MRGSLGSTLCEKTSLPQRMSSFVNPVILVGLEVGQVYLLGDWFKQLGREVDEKYHSIRGCCERGPLQLAMEKCRGRAVETGIAHGF